MSLLTRTYTFSDGTTAYGSQVESEVANIVNMLNNLDSGSTTWTNVKVTTLNLQGNVTANSHKITGLTPGNTSGDSVSYEQINGLLPPTGSITMFGSSSAPSGWLTCDGSAVSRTTYSGLFSVVSTSFGTGDGSTTFNLPNLVNFVPIGAGSTAALGVTVGAATVSIAHTHDMTHQHTVPVGDNGGVGTRLANITQWGQGSESIAQTNTYPPAGTANNGTFSWLKSKINDVANTGTSSVATVSTLQPSIGLTYIIKT